MSVRSAQSITVLFTTRVFATGVGTNADSLPTGTLFVNGTSNAATVTVTNISTGLYKAAVTLPTLAIGDEVEIIIAATVSTIADTAVVWGDTKDVLLDSSGDVTFNNTSIATVTTVGTLTTYTGNTPQTGDAFALIGTAGAGLTALGDVRIGHLNADVTSRMATYTQPTGFLAATFPTTVASPTNITAGTLTTITNLTNAPTVGDFTATMKTSIGTAVAASAVASVTAGVTLAASQHVIVDSGTVTTLTGDTPQTGDVFHLLTTALAESYAAKGAAGTLAQILYAIQQKLYEASVSGTTETIKKLDGATTAATETLNDPVSPTSVTRAS